MDIVLFLFGIGVVAFTFAIAYFLYSVGETVIDYVCGTKRKD